jgi:hypothetical protein
MAPQRHLDRGESGEVITDRRRDLALQEPSLDRIGPELEGLVHDRVRHAELRVVALAEIVAHLIEQALDLGGETLLAHALRLTCRSEASRNLGPTEARVQCFP